MKNTFYLTLFFLLFTMGCKKSPLNLQDKLCENGLCFSIQKFGENLQTRLSASSTGHAYAIYYEGTLQKWDQNGVYGNSLAINAINTQLNVASCAKSMTCVAAIKALDEANIKLDSPIINYLPSWWVKGSNVSLVTFRQLLRQESGFRPTSQCESYSQIKDYIASGIPPDSNGRYQYQNANFCIFRILIPTITGAFDKEHQIDDGIADVVTQNTYMQYMNLKVWQPMGAIASCSNPDDVLYYDWNNPNLAGINYGNECQNAGGGTISISVNDLAKVMYNARYTDKLLNNTQRSDMFNQQDPLGCYSNNVNLNKNWGGHFHHNGGLRNTSTSDSTLRGLDACWYTFHNGVVVAVATNSAGGCGLINSPYPSINDLIERAFDEAWTEQ